VTGTSGANGTAELHFLPVAQPVVVNIDEDSFWSTTCRELISSEIGRWLLNNGLAPWPSGAPPKVLLHPIGRAAFEVRLTPSQQ